MTSEACGGRGSVEQPQSCCIRSDNDGAGAIRNRRVAVSLIRDNSTGVGPDAPPLPRPRPPLKPPRAPRRELGPPRVMPGGRRPRPRPRTSIAFMSIRPRRPISASPVLGGGVGDRPRSLGLDVGRCRCCHLSRSSSVAWRVSASS
jgi:hypothetical protein